MRNIPKHVLAVIGVSGAAFIALAVLATTTGSWDDLLAAVLLLAAILIGTEIVRHQRARARREDARYERLATSLAQTAELARILANQPERLQPEHATAPAELTAKLEWMARRQAEIVRLLKEVRASTDEA